MRKSRLEVMKEQRAGPTKPRTMTYDDFIALILGGTPLPTQQAFIDAYLSEEEIQAAEARGEDDPGWYGAYMGPYGCAKTSTILAKAWLQALFEPGSQILIARQNFNDLKDTTYKRMEEMLGRLPSGTLVSREKSPPIKWVIQPIGEGDFSTFTFMGLTDALGSYEFHSAFVDEVDELERERFLELDGRCRLKGRSRIISCAFNPPSEDHWLYEACTGKDARGRPVGDGAPILKLFRPRANENARNVRSGYYESLRKRYPPDMVRRLVDGEWGSTFKGKPVYGEFSRAWHVKDELEFDPFLPLFRFWDFGYRFPVCLWTQPTESGGLNVLAEEMGQDVEIRPFVARIKARTTQWPAKTIIDFGDPAARQRKDTGSTLGVLTEEGITLRFIQANIEPGVRAVRHLLSRGDKGEPAFKIARQCHVTIRALEGGYHYPDDGVGDQLKPVKDGYYDHTMDALRYGVTNVFGIIGNLNTSAQQSLDRLPENVSYKPEYDIFPTVKDLEQFPQEWVNRES
jgi:PBSX family phage terminase large subunit